MSRCYPFPPPGYAGKCSSHEALILSIKLQKEKEKEVSACEGAKAVSNRDKDKSKSSEKNKDKEQRKDKKRNREERKEHKKDKEERKKEKKEKRAAKKAKIAAPADADKQNVVKQFSKVDDSLVPESKGKLQGSSCELLERSIVTEEHGQPIESQNVPCSSDSTGNSGKRKKSSSSPSGIQSSGHIIRLRFSASKKDEPSTSGSKLQVGPPQQMRVEKPYGLVRPCATSDSKLQEVGPPQQMRVEKPYGLVRRCATNVKAESSVKQQNKDDNKLVSYVMQKDDQKPVSSVKQNRDVIIAEPSVKQNRDVVIAEPPVKQNRDVVIAEPPVKQNRDVVIAESSVKQKDVASTSRAPLQPASSKDDSGSKAKNEKQLSFHETIQVREKMVAKLSSHDRRKQKKEAAYQNLFVDWAAPPPALERIIAMEVDEDEDWLFGKKNKDTSTDRLRGSDDSNVRCGASAVIQPRACFLADAEIYALPYTVPF